MFFCIRDAEQNYDYCSGTKLSEDGLAAQISRENIHLQVLEHATINNTEYPSKWRIELPNTAPIQIESITKNALNKLSVQYWEGRVKASGGFNGLGYAELSGY